MVVVLRGLFLYSRVVKGTGFSIGVILYFTKHFPYCQISFINRTRVDFEGQSRNIYKNVKGVSFLGRGTTSVPP